MTFCNPITVDEDNTIPLLDSEDSPITTDPCLFVVLSPEDFTEVDADVHSAPITVGVFVITDEIDEEGENILVPAEAATMQLEPSGGELESTTLYTEQDGLAQTQLITDNFVGSEYVVRGQLISFTYQGRERFFTPNEAPILNTAVIQVISGNH